jgi:hypothetical protein
MVDSTAARASKDVPVGQDATVHGTGDGHAIDPRAMRLASGVDASPARFAINLIADAVRLSDRAATRLATRLCARPSSWLVSIPPTRPVYATVVGDAGDAVCNACVRAAFCIHRADVNAVEGEVVCTVPRGWTPSADSTVLQAARQVPAFGSKRPAHHGQRTGPPLLRPVRPPPQRLTWCRRGVDVA